MTIFAQNDVNVLIELTSFPCRCITMLTSLRDSFLYNVVARYIFYSSSKICVISFLY